MTVPNVRPALPKRLVVGSILIVLGVAVSGALFVSQQYWPRLLDPWHVLISVGAVLGVLGASVAHVTDRGWAVSLIFVCVLLASIYSAPYLGPLVGVGVVLAVVGLMVMWVLLYWIRRQQ